MSKTDSWDNIELVCDAVSVLETTPGPLDWRLALISIFIFRLGRWTGVSKHQRLVSLLRTKRLYVSKHICCK